MKTLIPYQQCQETNWNPNKVSREFICAGDLVDGGESTCVGDSGGPLVPVGRNDDTTIGTNHILCTQKDGIHYTKGSKFKNTCTVEFFVSIFDGFMQYSRKPHGITKCFM